MTRDGGVARLAGQGRSHVMSGPLLELCLVRAFDDRHSLHAQAWDRQQADGRPDLGVGSGGATSFTKAAGDPVVVVCPGVVGVGWSSPGVVQRPGELVAELVLGIVLV